MSEPPKPITDLAEPIGRSRPRGPNRLGNAALILWVCVFVGTLVLGALVGRGPTGGSLFHPASDQVTVFLGLPGALTGVVISIVALSAARKGHLRRVEALLALVLSSLLFLVCLPFAM